MKLLIARPSPFARKVRIALLEKGIAFETLVDLPWNPGAQAPAMNPLAFSASSGIRGGRQKVGEANADGLALTGRVQYQLGTSTVLGGAGYFGMAGPNARVGDDLDVPVAGFAADVRTAVIFDKLV